MGAGASFNIPDEAKIRERFLRITSPGAYANVLQIQDILPENMTVDMYNVALLFCLDDDHSGQFSIEKIIDFDCCGKYMTFLYFDFSSKH